MIQMYIMRLFVWMPSTPRKWYGLSRGNDHIGFVLFRVFLLFLLSFFTSLTMAEHAQIPPPPHRVTSFLKLETVLRSVNHSFPEIIAARYELGQAQGDLLSAWGRFDPSIKTNTRTEPMGGYVTNYVNSEYSVPTLTNGMRLFGGYRIGRGNFPIYYQNYLTNKWGEYRAGVALPLMQGKDIDKARAELFNQAQTIEIKKYNIAATKINVYRDAIVAYWQWVESGLKLNALKHLLNLAETRQDAIIKQAQQGDLARVAIAENEQIIMQRQQLVNQGQMMLDQAAMNLALYFRDNFGKPQLPQASQIPNLHEFLKLSHKLARLDITEDQIRHHPTIAKIRGNYKIAKMRLTLAQNELLPNFDSVAYTSKQYGQGTPQLVPQTIQVGLHFYFPIHQREARGKIISTRSELRRLFTEKNYLTDQLRRQAAYLSIALKTFRQQIKVVTRELALSKRVENAEVKRFYQGDSTLFLVNQREQNTVQARINQIEIQATLLQTSYLIQYFTLTDQRKTCVLRPTKQIPMHFHRQR
jgi:outer membrane protein TolC